VGLLDHYRQFEALTPEEQRRQAHERALERKRDALDRVERLDLASTTWPGLPHHTVVTAVTWTARRGMQGYADPAGGELRAELARRHGLAAGRVAVGHGAAQLLEAASQELLGPGDELLSPWPTYPLYPSAGPPLRRAGGARPRQLGGRPGRGRHPAHAPGHVVLPQRPHLGGVAVDVGRQDDDGGPRSAHQFEVAGDDGRLLVVREKARRGRHRDAPSASSTSCAAIAALTWQ